MPILPSPLERTSGRSRAAMAIALGFLAAATAPAQTTIPAFPGAEGFGATTPGGRGGDIIEVTNLNDSGPGSLREAMEVRTGPRIVVVKVGGTIALSREIVVREANSYLTVAGQKAPGDGIQLKNYGIALRDGAHDVVVRYIRSRPGDTTPGIWDKDGVLLYGVGGKPVHDVVFDHCSIEWAVDENVNVWQWVENATFQWCLIAEGSQTGHPKGPHSMGLLSGADPRITLTVHHCLLAHNGGRNPLLQDNSLGANDFRNNVIYNWLNNNAGDAKYGARVNYVGNTYIAGPDTSTVWGSVFYVPDETNSSGVGLYVRDNRGPNCPSGCQDEWDIGVWWWDGQYHFADEQAYREPVPLPVPIVTTQPADVACEQVLLDAGATLPRRDPVDSRIVNEVRTRTGAVGIGSDYPVLRGGNYPSDRDHDGMPDAWEAAYGLDIRDPSDARGDLNGDGYTNIEEFLNGRDPTLAPAVPAASGAVPDGLDVSGRMLEVRGAGGDRVVLDWGVSCLSGDTDFEVYEGELGDFTSHSALYCSTNGQTTVSFEDFSGSAYYLVVPRGVSREGSYGRDSFGAERPVGVVACLNQTPAPCP